jgi:hypothetical protein
MTSIPPYLGPADDEAAVLSMLAVRDSESNGWRVAAGSLLTVPLEAALMSWPQWKLRQFQTRAPSPFDCGLDPGPIFCIEPFNGVRGVRVVVWPQDWDDVLRQIEAGAVNVQQARYEIPGTAWSPVALLAQNGQTPAHEVVIGVQRPVSGMIATLDEIPIPPAGDTWKLALPPSLEPGPDLGAMHRWRTLMHWPMALLGIRWLGTDKFAPPSRLVVGRASRDAWIVDARPDPDDAEMLEVSIGWNEHQIDPLGCTLSARADFDGAPLLTQQLRISDLPGNVEDRPAADEPRHKTWHERVLTVRLPRGPRRTSWGVSLFGPAGQLLDEEPTAARIEQISIAFHVDGSDTATSTSVIGDRTSPPTAAERSQAAMVAVELLSQSTVAATKRRVATAGELRDYLRWRLSCRAGELLLLDPHLLRGDEKTVAEVVDFLAALDRPVRALTYKAPDEDATALLTPHPRLDVRALPEGRRTLHDRIWIVGQTALMVGTSINHFIRDEHPATTVSELPFADAVLWGRRFEQWWSRTPLVVPTAGDYSAA